jgi:hypothetical protein
MKTIHIFLIVFLIFSCGEKGTPPIDIPHVTYLQTFKCGNDSYGMFSYEGQFYISSIFKPSDSLLVFNKKYPNVAYFKSNDKFEDLKKYRLEIIGNGMSRKDIPCLYLKDVPFAIVSKVVN